MDRSRLRGFALPTVLVASIVMLSVLLVAVSSTASISTALKSQYYGQLSQAASDAGSAYAKACLADNNGSPRWSDTKPLMPGTDCTGTQIVGFTCPEGSIDSRCIVSFNNNVISTFSVGLPQLDSSGNATNVNATGIVKLIRSSDNSTWRQYAQNYSTKINSPTISLLVVGGGGGGGGFGGGGGGGGLLYKPSLSVATQSYSVTVGAGGTGDQTNSTGNRGANGGDSVFGSIVASGGGGGGSRTGSPWTGVTGSVGGSGGGGSPADIAPQGIGGIGISGQGNSGGNGGNFGWGGGGGGGAGAVGANANVNSGGAGGSGLPNSISGSTVYYAGGGGGCVYNTGAVGAGGAGGGGAGGLLASGVSGAVNTGGGGGGASAGAYVGGNGGSGVVVISYPTGSMVATGGTVTTSGLNTIHTFNSSGTFSVLPTASAIKVLVVGGGGGSSAFGGGGAGAGGVIYNDSYNIAVQSYPVMVGSGGAGGVVGVNSGLGNNGNNSQFGTLTAFGGGASGSDGIVNGTAGGSGGGAGTIDGGSCAGGGIGGTKISNQGNAGGNEGAQCNKAAGGGGAGSPGVAGALNNRGGDGGAGLTYSISGASVSYGGGGGGSVRTGSGVLGGNGGLGGGGRGDDYNSLNGTAGTANTGGGGGGSQGYATTTAPGHAGGSGIVIVSYPTASITATGGMITYTDSNNLNPRSSPSYTGGYTIHTFTSNDIFTVSNIVTSGLVLNLDGGNGSSISPNVHPYATNLYSWVTTGQTSTLSRDTISSPVGNTPLKMVVTGNDPYAGSYGSSQYNLAPTSVGKTWTISTWIKASTNTSAQLFIMGATSAGAYNESGAATVNVTTDWKRYSYTYTTTSASTAYVQIRLDGPQSGGTGQTIWFDGVQVEQGKNMSNFIKNSVSPNVFTYSKNVYSWVTTANAATLTRDTITSPAGNTPLRMAVTGTDPYTSYSLTQYNIAPTAVGRTWTVSAWIRSDAATTAQLFIMGNNAAGNAIESGSATFSVTTSWQFFKHTYTLANAATVFVSARLDGPDTGGAGRVVWFDGVQVRQGTNLSTAWNDVSGANNNANLVNETTDYSNGTAFDGTDDKAIMQGPIISTSGAFTVEGWVNLSTFSSTDRGNMIVGNYAGLYKGFYMNVNTSGYPNFYVGRQSDSSGISATSSSAISLNNWYNIVGVYDGSGTRIYVNGVLKSSQTYSPVEPETANTYLGGGQWSNNIAQLTGSVGAVHIYNRALSFNEIQQNYSALSGLYGVSGGAVLPKVLVIAGGGAGGALAGGGGGAGGLLYESIHSIPVGSYPVVVGSGGTAVSNATGNNGGLSSFDTMSAVGGGGGAVGGVSGASGGSGGGGGGSTSVSTSGGSGTSLQGFNGGFTQISANRNGGGGGGSSYNGGHGDTGSNAYGRGGYGLSIAITGSPILYAGGGGSGGGGGGGIGQAGGGNGSSTTNGGAGSANTGGGGGGGGPTFQGGNGGSGVVIISYPTGSMTSTGGNSITYSGGWTIVTFTSSGTFVRTN